jgi:hypothetical protein
VEQKLAKLFCQIKCEPNCRLAENVWCALLERDERIARLKLWGFSVVGFISLAALVPTVRILSDDLAQSGFFDYFSLLAVGFSFNSSVFSYWRELGLSLLESLPALIILFLLALIFIFFLSFKYAIRQIRTPRVFGAI